MGKRGKTLGVRYYSALFFAIVRLKTVEGACFAACGRTFCFTSAPMIAIDTAFDRALLLLRFLALDDVCDCGG